jgi:hypothetical protein
MLLKKPPGSENYSALRFIVRRKDLIVVLAARRTVMNNDVGKRPAYINA